MKAPNKNNIIIMKISNKKVSISVFIGFLLIIVDGKVAAVSIDELINE